MKFESSPSPEATDESRYSREETDYDTITQIEHQEVIDNPENVGFNITDEQMVRPRRQVFIREVHGLIEEVGEENAFKMLSEKYGFSPEEIKEKYTEMYASERKKMDEFPKFLEKFPDGASFRVHPYASESPFSVEHSRRQSEDGTYFSIDPLAIEQMKMLYRKVNSGEKPGELTVVMNNYASERGGNTPETPEEIEEYARMCITFLRQMGLEENGGAGICLELGNETNVDKQTTNFDGEKMFTMNGFADKADPAKYAHMYVQVARKIKEQFPNVKIAVAGTALYDEEYLSSVIDGVQAESGEDEHLIDKVSFHPYRETVEEGATTFKDGKRVPSELSYDEQLEHMQALADRVGATFDIGEVSFSSNRGTNVDTIELHRNSQHAREHGLKSYTWPETHILEYE